MHRPDLSHFLDFARKTAVLAGNLTLQHYQTDLQAAFKADDSPVTVADRAAERLIRDRIAATFPGHAIVGEEYGADPTEEATHRWYVDPIDGTKSFMRGVPLYAVLLGLEIDGRVEVGVAHFPALGEMVAAATGAGCWWHRGIGGKETAVRARVSGQARLDRAFMAHVDTASFARLGRGDAWGRLQDATYYNAGWCDAYSYTLVATGRVEIALDPIMNAWDCAPFPPILREAGGYFGDWQGNETIHAGEALATTPALLPDVLALLNPPAV